MMRSSVCVHITPLMLLDKANLWMSIYKVLRKCYALDESMSQYIIPEVPSW